jgi:hypothetical protein
MIVTLGRAINLLQTGLSVIPIGELKQPFISWKKFQNEQIIKEDLEKHSSNPKFRGYGIVTGFNNLECMDVDLKVFESLTDQKSFWNEYLQMLTDHIDDFDRKFVIYKTINSGYHIIYRCKEIGGNQKIAKLKGHKSQVLETRGVGGYIFVYENQISKLGYEDIQEVSLDDRNILFGISKFYDYKEAIDTAIKQESKGESLSPWQDYNNRNSVFDAFGTDFSIVRQLSDKTIIKRAGATSPHSGYVYNNSGLMYLFSTGTIYPHENALSPFSIYAWKYHGGNYSEAGKELYKQGFGERKIKKIEIEKPEIQKEDLLFPIEVFPEDIQTYIIQNQKTLNHSIDYMGSSFLWLIASCIGNACKIEVKVGWRESANIWIGLIGKAGLGKTPSINAMIFPIKKRNAFEVKQYQREFKKWKEYEKLSAKEKKDFEEVKEPKRTQFIVNDVTIEALADIHEENQNGISVFKDELNGWLKDMNKYKPGSDLEFWLSCWSGEPAALTRKTAKSSFIELPLIPVLGGVQPGIFSQISTVENKDNGFLDRLLLSFPEKDIEHYNRNSISQNLLDWYEAYVCNFYDHIKRKVLSYKFDSIDPKILRLDQEADLEWERIFNNVSDMQNSDEINEYVKSMLSKQKSYIPRFALMLHCLDCYDTEKNLGWIDKSTMLKAEKLSNYFIAMSKKIKISMLESKGLIEIVASMKGEPVEQIVKQIFANNPETSKIEVAEILNISKRSVYNYLKK